MAERAPFIASCVADTARRRPLGAGAVVEHHQDLPCGLRAGAGRRRPARSRPADARPPLHAAATPAAHQRIELLHRASRLRSRARRAMTDPWSDEHLLALSESVAPLFEPGQGWTYSNTGYFLVRRLIEQTTGNDIERALTDSGAGAARHLRRVHRAHARRSAAKHLGRRGRLPSGMGGARLADGSSGGCGAVHAPAVHRRAVAARRSATRCASAIR